MPLFSQDSAAGTIPADKISTLDKQVQDAGADVVNAKNDKGSATLSMGYAGARLSKAELAEKGTPSRGCVCHVNHARAAILHEQSHLRQAVEVILDTQKSVGHPSRAALHAGLKGDWAIACWIFGASVRGEAAEVLLEPKSLMAIPLEQLSMQVSKEMGHCFLDFWAFARAEAVEVILDTQNSAGHPSRAALHAGLKGDGPLLVGLLGLCAC